MKSNLVSEIIIVCVSAFCILIMSVIMVDDKKNPDLEMTEAVRMTSDGSEVGILNSRDEGKEAIEKIKTSYIESSNIKDVSDIEINNNIEFESVLCSKDDIETTSQVSNKVISYNDSNDNSLISFTVIRNNEVDYSDTKYAIDTSYGSSGELYKEVFLDSSLYTPIRGVLTSPFGETRDGYCHKGIDLAASTGTAIGAAMSGVVSFSGTAGGYGCVVMVDHGNNLKTVYAHCSELDVSQGERVERGQTIARVGSTGDSTGPHLHFEIRINEVPIDPLQYSSTVYQY